MLPVRYAARYGVEFVARLGDGKDGFVLQTNQRTAVKFLHDRDHCIRELRAYRLLANGDVDEIAGHQVPRLLRSDEELLAIEMTVVQPPFIVDFVSAYADDEVEWLGFTEDVMAEREAFWAERFGDRWPAVLQIRDEFHRVTGLTLLDLSHNNIRFE